MPYRVGCDVGGTFTDLCLVDSDTGESVFVKIPTTVGEEASAVIAGTQLALDEGHVVADAVASFAHGTTVATNAVLERKGATTVLLVTEGFRDLMLIARQMRAHLYDARVRRPPPLVPRHLTFEVPERIGPDGTVLKPLEPKMIVKIAKQLAREKATSAAVLLLHSYANPIHERQVRDILRAELPELDISLSSEVLPKPGEYERASTTVMNAYLMPPLRRYLGKLHDGLAGIGVPQQPMIMQSNGGVMTAETAGAAKSVHTCLSGPAAGLIGAAAFAKAAGFTDVVTIDMGGTSFDVGLIKEGEILTRFEGEIAGFPLRVPMFDIVTLGAGGGSIAYVDAGGLLHVGPESAGAVPGPAAYGRGGTRPTVTDANVVLGKLRQGRRLDGGIVIDRTRAVGAIGEHVGEVLGLDEIAAADGIRLVVNAAMVRGIRRMTVERGLDPRNFALMAFGGAGPLHAIDLAQELSIGTVIVPPSPGLLCATGLLLSPWRHDETMSLGVTTDTLKGDDLERQVAELGERASKKAREDGVDANAVSFRAALDLRYVGQGYEITTPLNDSNVSAAANHFHKLHQQSYGYQRRNHAVEIMTLRLIASAAAPVTRLPVPKFEEGDARVGRAEVILHGRKANVEVVERRRLLPGVRRNGPLLIEQPDTTLLIGEQAFEIDGFGNILVEVVP